MVLFRLELAVIGCLFLQTRLCLAFVGSTQRTILHNHHDPTKVPTSPSLLKPKSFTSPSKKREIQKKSSVGESCTQLYSLNRLVDEIVNDSSAAGPRVVFVGGKGGVGKTTVSSALAIELASSQDTRVLIVSTDPAHSLGDALDENLQGGKNNDNKPLLMTDPLTMGRLYACEIDATAALRDFQENLASAFDANRLADALGVSSDMLESLGLEDFSNLLNNPPPGLDELVALANVLDPNSSAMSGDDPVDVIIVDTAPTGHTLRLLALPQFLDGLLGKLIRLRMKLAGLASTLQAFLGGGEQAQQRAQTIDTAMDRLESFKTKMSGLRTRLMDPTKTGFLVVSVPTKLSVAESKRLMQELSSQGVTVTDVVINQCVTNSYNSDGDAMKNYYSRRKHGQEKWIQELEETAGKVSATKEYKSNGDDNKGGIKVTKVPFIDVELVGVPALAYLGRECFVDNPNFHHLMNDDDSGNKVVICGGKGGVGKTTTSAALAVSMASQGHNVALVSTDPAHSLGDAIDLNLAGGALQDCPLIGIPFTEGSLSVLEIDPSTSLSQFKSVIDNLLGSSTKDGGGGGGLGDTLRDFGEIFDTLPAGTDEVVALAKVVNLVKKGGFDRIVLDTAPTGHTIRMLSTPAFLADLIERVLALAKKVNSNAAIKMLVNSAASASAEELETAGETAKSTLLNFQLQMYDLEDLFANPDQTEFLIVTVPTELAVRESVRLLNDLTFEAPDMPVKVRNVVVNQVLQNDDDGMESFLTRVREGQETSIQQLEAAVSNTKDKPHITQVQYLDTEPRGVYGLKVLATELMKEKK